MDQLKIDSVRLVSPTDLFGSIAGEDQNPLAWPFCIAGAAVGTAATIAAAPLYAVGTRPHYYYGYPYYGYYGRPYYRAGYFPSRRYYKKKP
jgi:hypothetical protein